MFGMGKKKEVANDIELARVGEPKKGAAPEDTDYRPVNWKRIFLTPKYIRTLAFPQPPAYTNRLPALHILGVVAIVATILLTIYHDQAVQVSRSRTRIARHHY